MPPFPGEERLVTLFTDCHYYFAEPVARPVLHRFDKASYFYIYWNSTRQTSRLEVANNPGTPDQDAFNGYLDTCRVINSYKFPTLVTLVVDATDNASSPVASKAGRDPDEWRLTSADPRDANQTKYRLHTIDFYFWTMEDAKLVTGLFRKLLNLAQLDLVEPQQQQQQQQQQQKQQQQQQQQQKRQSGDTGVSSVVQNLENVAISDPAYSNGQTRNSQNQAQSQPMHIPPPPPPPPPLSQPQAESRSTVSPAAASPSPVSQPSRVGSRKSPQSDSHMANFTPLAYNPAAPAAPEKIAHREKTPPPEDGQHGTGLSAVAMHDHAPTPSYNPSQSWGAPPATSQISQPGHWGSPPPPSGTTGYGTHLSTSAAQGYGSQLSPSTGYKSPQPPQYQQGRSPAASGVPPGPPSFAPPPAVSPVGQDSHRHSTAAELYTPDPHAYDSQVETPGTQFYNTVPQPNKPLAHVQPQYADYLSAGTKPGQQPPPGGWSDYQYAPGGYGGQPGSHGSSYNVHNQVYRPTEAEANAHSRRHSKPSRSDTASSTSDSKKGKFGGFLKKLEKEAKKF